MYLIGRDQHVPGTMKNNASCKECDSKLSRVQSGSTADFQRYLFLTVCDVDKCFRRTHHNTIFLFHTFIVGLLYT